MPMTRAHCVACHAACAGSSIAGVHAESSWQTGGATASTAAFAARRNLAVRLYEAWRNSKRPCRPPALAAAACTAYGARRGGLGWKTHRLLDSEHKGLDNF
eukprot:364076-Chlamydomonas_euryale.AAC.9